MEELRMSDALKAYIRTQRNDDEIKGITAQALADAFTALHYARIHMNNSQRMERMIASTERILAEFSLLLDLMREKGANVEPQRGENLYG